MPSVNEFPRTPAVAAQFDAAVALSAHLGRRPKAFRLRLKRAMGKVKVSDINFETCLDCVAIENGFTNWEDLWRWENLPPSGDLAAGRWFIERIMSGRAVESYSVADGDKEEWRLMVGIRLAQLDPSLDLSSFDAENVNTPIEPLGVTPLVYVCCSRYGNSISELRARRKAWASRLLQLGADPSAGMRERDSIRGYRTCLGGAIGQARDSQLVKLLLQKGADIQDGPTLYEGSAMWESVRLRDHDSLDLLLAAEPPEWHVCHALTHCLQFHDLSMVEKLLANNADPNWDKTVYGMEGNALHEAIQCDCHADFIKVLIKAGAKVDELDRGGRTPFAVATAMGRPDLCRAIKSRSKAARKVGPWEKWVGACMRTDVAQHAELFEEIPSSYRKSYHDCLWMHTLVRKGDVVSLGMLNEQWGNYDQIDYRGETALHIAVRLGNDQTIRQLGLLANATIENFEGETAVDLAVRLASAENSGVIDALWDWVEHGEFLHKGNKLSPKDVDAFEQAADAVSEGDVESLRSLLDEYPHFVKARSTRPHHCTLLNYIGVNGFEGERQRSPSNATEVIKLLLERGADPNALCYTYRGGPGETTLGLLLSSGVVDDDKQLLEMARTMVSGGAVIERELAILFMMLDAQDSGQTQVAAGIWEPDDSSVEAAFRLLTEHDAIDAMAALLKAGVDIDGSNEHGQTALHMAAFQGKSDLVDWLLARGADLSRRETQFHGTPAGWAAVGGHPKLANRLADLEREVGR